MIPSEVTPLNPSHCQVVVVGASARALAHSAKRAGYDVIAVDYFADFDTAEFAKVLTIDTRLASESRPLETVVEKLKSDIEQAIKPNAEQVYTVYVGGLENKPELVDMLANIGVLLGNSKSVLRRLLDRFSIHQFLQGRGFRVPRSLTDAEFRDLIADPSCQSVQNTKWLKKKFLSCGGLGIQLVQLAADFQTASIECDNHRRNDYYQEFIEGEVFSASYLAGDHWGNDPLGDDESGQPDHSRKRACLIGITRQLSGDSRFNASGYLYCGSLIEPHPPRPLIDFADSIGQALAEEYGLQGLFNIDFVAAKDGFYFLEINPRFSSSMELFERQFGINLFDWQLESTQSNTSLEYLDQRTGYEGQIQAKAIWYAKESCIVGSSFPELASQQIDPAGLPLIADIPCAGTLVREGAPAFTVFARGDSTAQVAEKLVETGRMFASLLPESKQ